MKQTVKPELKSLDMKAAYIAAHWGQKIMFWTMNGCNDLHKISASGMSKQSIPQKSILLTPLDQITDEDAIEVGRLHGHEDDENCWTDEYLLYVGKRVSGYFPNNTTPVPVKNLIRITDFLRSKGYAVRWMDYEVEELIAAGYCQLKGGNV